VPYESTTRVLSAGMHFRPNDKIILGVSLNYTAGEASMGSFDLSNPEFTERFPLLSWDFSRTPEWSNIDINTIDTWVDLQYRFSTRLFARGAYRYVKADDSDPYLYDLSGRNNVVHFSLGYLF